MSVSLKVKIFDSSGTRILNVAKSTLTIGSASHCDVVLDHPSVAAEHTRAWLDGGRIWIQDLGGSAGTALNDIRLPGLKPMLVRDLDVLRLGECPSTIGLEAILVRAPVVKSKSADPVAKEISATETKGISNIELQKRREEAESLAREVADLRLQLQMATLEKSSADEMAHQLTNLRGEIERVQEQKHKWDENFKQLEVEKQTMRKNIDKELADFKAKAMKDLKKAAGAEAQVQVQALNEEIKRLQEQSEKLNALLREANSEKSTLINEKDALRAEFKNAASSQSQNLSSEIKKLNEKNLKIAEDLRKVEAEREAIRKAAEKERQEHKANTFKEVNTVLLNEGQKFESWKKEAFLEMNRQVQKLAQQKVRTWARQVFNVDMAAELEADISQSLQRVLVNDDVSEPAPVHTGRQVIKGGAAVTHSSARMAAATATSTSSTGSSGERDEAREARRAKRRRQARASARMWRMVTVTSLVVAFILAGVWLGSSYLRNHGSRALSSTAPDKSMERPPEPPPTPVQQKPSAQKFQPKQGRKYRGTYTENVLYLENYVAAEENSEFRKRWMNELSKVASGEWRVDTWTISPIGVEEQVLIQDLDRLRVSINPEHEQEGIEKMRARENKFLKDLEAVFKNRAGVDRFLKFKRSFYQRNQAYLTRSS